MDRTVDEDKEKHGPDDPVCNGNGGATLVASVAFHPVHWNSACRSEPMRRLSALPTTIMTKLHRYLWAYRRQFRTGSTQSNTHQARCAAWSANTGGTSSASAQSPTQEGSAMIRHMTWAGSM